MEKILAKRVIRCKENSCTQERLEIDVNLVEITSKHDEPTVYKAEIIFNQSTSVNSLLKLREAYSLTDEKVARDMFEELALSLKIILAGMRVA